MMQAAKHQPSNNTNTRATLHSSPLNSVDDARLTAQVVQDVTQRSGCTVKTPLKHSALLVDALQD